MISDTENRLCDGLRWSDGFYKSERSSYVLRDPPGMFSCITFDCDVHIFLVFGTKKYFGFIDINIVRINASVESVIATMLPGKQRGNEVSTN